MKEIFEYIRSDYYRYTGKRGGVKDILLELFFSRNDSFKYNFWLRLASRPTIFFPLAVLIHEHQRKKYGIHIGIHTKIGYGFQITHPVGIVINGRTVIGNNVKIHQFLTIGSDKGTPATIGDNVYIGPNVCIVEDVKIGSNSCIAAGAVVVKDVPEESTVAGCPAKVIGSNKHPEYIRNKWNV